VDADQRLAIVAEASTSATVTSQNPL